MPSWFSAKIDAGGTLSLHPTHPTTITNACVSQRNPIEEGTRGSLIFEEERTPQLKGPVAAFLRYACEQVVLDLELEAGSVYYLQAKGSLAIDLVGVVKDDIDQDAAPTSQTSQSKTVTLGKRKALASTGGESAPKKAADEKLKAATAAQKKKKAEEKAEEKAAAEEEKKRKAEEKRKVAEEEKKKKAEQKKKETEEKKKVAEENKKKKSEGKKGDGEKSTRGGSSRTTRQRSVASSAYQGSVASSSRRRSVASSVATREGVEEAPNSASRDHQMRRSGSNAVVGANTPWSYPIQLDAASSYKRPQRFLLPAPRSKQKSFPSLAVFVSSLLSLPSRDTIPLYTFYPTPLANVLSSVHVPRQQPYCQMDQKRPGA
ncbi:hypothetical protein D9611_009726 [Ephemerocybe angulata]|uniref:Nucleoplasmin-like domain-containing protein n=1 Tax=Ephemerocybe angulata TaxID=980116 RepID=A0A8H5C5X9_9AGAR|nr:hypothetical protein D9611_009726 [Tulosesus angulatus]